VTSVGAFLTDILGWHRRVGSPLGDFLRDGITGAEVASTLASVGIGVDGIADELCDLYSCHNGVDQEAWDRAEMPWPAELWPGAVFFDIDRAVGTYAANRDTAMVASREVPGSEPDEYWPDGLLPIFGLGVNAFGVDCHGPAPGEVWAWYWEPTAEDPCRRVAASLEELLESVRGRFDVDAYRWDPERQIVVEDHDRLSLVPWPADRNN